MKKPGLHKFALAILLSSVCLMPMLMHYGLFIMKTQELRSQLWYRISASEDDFLKITISKDQFSKASRNHNKEVEYNGLPLDILSMKQKDDSLHLICYADFEEQLLLGMFGDLSPDAGENTLTRNLKKQLCEWQLFSEDGSHLTFLTVPKKTMQAEYSFRLADPLSDTPAPPPRGV